MKRSSMLGLLFCVACSDGDGDDGGSGVDGSLKLSALTSAQKTDVCRAAISNSYRSVSVKDVCTYEAVDETSNLTECKEYAAECEAELSGNGLQAAHQDDLDDCDDIDEEEGALDCDSTVAEYERCYREDDAAYAKRAQQSSCTDAGKDIGYDDYASVECERILDECYLY